MQVVYNGAHPEVVVDEFDPEQVIVSGEPVEIPDDLAARLLEQDTWTLVETDAQRQAREKREADEAAAAMAAAADVAAQAKLAADKAASPTPAPLNPTSDITTKGNN